MAKKLKKKQGSDLFYVDKLGKRQDRELWDTMLGDDKLPKGLEAPPQKRSPSKRRV